MVNAGGGRPVLCDHRGSVIAPSWILADAMTKIALAEPAKAQRLLKRYGGYLLYYLGDEALRAASSLIHWAIGLALPAVLVWHSVNGQHARRAVKAKRPRPLD